jgi:hypothetical protein
MSKKCPIVYPFTFEEWLNHPSTKWKLKRINKDCDEMRLNKKYGVQLSMKLI